MYLGATMKNTCFQLWRCALGSFLAAGVLAVSTPATAASLLSHRAVYDLTLLESRASASITDIQGRLVLEWAGDMCEGYTVTQRLVSEMLDTEGGRNVSDLRMTSWEAPDGSSYRFELSHYFNGDVVEEVSGRASAAADGGEAVFRAPEELTLELPAGTSFPTQHMVEVLASADQEGRVLEQPVFDGSGLDSLYSTTAFIADWSSTGKPSQGAAWPELTDRESWKVRIGYFSPERQASVPEYEIGFRLYDNGVSSDLVMDYGDFVLSGELLELETINQAPCDP